MRRRLDNVMLPRKWKKRESCHMTPGQRLERETRKLDSYYLGTVSGLLWLCEFTWGFESNSVEISKNCYYHSSLDKGLQAKKYCFYCLVFLNVSINAHGPSGPSHGSKIISLERRGEFTGLSLVRKQATESHNKEKHHCFNKWLWLLHRRSGDLGFWD